MPGEELGPLEQDLDGLVLPEQGVIELADKLTGYLNKIELGEMPDVIGQVLDDFLDQCGGIPEDLNDPASFEKITGNQLAVTLAYQLGRLDGRSPQVVRTLIQQVIEKWGLRPVEEMPDISEGDLRHPKELVYPRLRRLEYSDMDDGDDLL